MNQETVSPSETIVEHIIRSIRDAVRKGEFAPGQRLVVADISQTFGVSPGPVREAIRRLAGEGLLEFIPHKGAAVRQLHEEDIREIFQAREAVEGYIARLAAENINREDYKHRLLRCLDDLQSAGQDMARVTAIRQEFHDLLYLIAGNRTLQEMAERLTSPLYRLSFNYQTGKDRLMESLHEHERIIEAIVAGNGVTAERLMRTHLRNGSAAVCDALAETALLTDHQ